MTKVQNIGYQIWLLWQNLKWINVAKSIFSVLGALWLIIEVLAFFNKDEFSEGLKSIWWLFLIIGIVWVIYENWPKQKYSYQVKGKDVSITLQIGDIFKIQGALILPVNNKFDVDNKGIIKKSSSILRHFIKNTYKDVTAHLDTDINNQISDNPNWYEKFYLSTEPRLFKIGTVVPIFREERQYYLLSNSTLNEQNRSKCTEDDLQNSLIELWAYLSQCGSKDNLVIPIIGTGRGRINLTREEVIKEIVLSFLVSLSVETYCEQLTICIHPADIKKFKINIDDLADFIKLHCTNTNFSRLNDPNKNNNGQTIE